MKTMSMERILTQKTKTQIRSHNTRLATAVILSAGLALGASQSFADELNLTIPIKALSISGSPTSNTGVVNVFESQEYFDVSIIPSLSIDTKLERAVFANLISALSTEKQVTFNGENINNCNDASTGCIFSPERVDF
jgi:hypothetical protein